MEKERQDLQEQIDGKDANDADGKQREKDPAEQLEKTEFLLFSAVAIHFSLCYNVGNI